MSEVHKCHDYELYDIDGKYYSLSELKHFIAVAQGEDN